jgi:hypothetical protein
MLLIDLAKNIDPNHIGNLVLENTNAPISEPSTAPAESGLIHLANQGARYLAP